jgi:hypothetical protein
MPLLAGIPPYLLQIIKYVFLALKKAVTYSGMLHSNVNPLKVEAFHVDFVMAFASEYIG